MLMLIVNVNHINVSNNKAIFPQIYCVNVWIHQPPWQKLANQTNDVSFHQIMDVLLESI